MYVLISEQRLGLSDSDFEKAGSYLKIDLSKLKKLADKLEDIIPDKMPVLSQADMERLKIRTMKLDVITEFGNSLNTLLNRYMATDASVEKKLIQKELEYFPYAGEILSKYQEGGDLLAHFKQDAGITARYQKSEALINIEEVLKSVGSNEIYSNLKEKVESKWREHYEIVSAKQNAQKLMRKIISILSFRPWTTRNLQALESLDESFFPFFEKAVRIIVDTGSCSILFLQHKIALGPQNAKRLMGYLQDAGIVGPAPTLSSPDDQLFKNAAQIVADAIDEFGGLDTPFHGFCSVSFLQQKLNIGSECAERLMGYLQDAGIVGPANGDEPRKVLLKSSDELNEIDYEPKNVLLSPDELDDALAMLRNKEQE